MPLLEEAGAEVTLAIEELRQIAHGIHPVALNLGLAAAIKSVADRSSVPFAILDLPSERLDDTAEATAYYVLAEAATNAQRYAQASLITVRATSDAARRCASRSSTTESAAPTRPSASVWKACAIASSRSVAASRSRAPSVTGPASPRRYRRPPPWADDDCSRCVITWWRYAA